MIFFITNQETFTYEIANSYIGFREGKAREGRTNNDRKSLLGIRLVQKATVKP